MYHVKELTTAPPGGLDLNIADEEEFSPDKLRANIERLYMTIVSVPRATILMPANSLSGYWNDGIRQTHRANPIVARDTSDCMVLRCLLPCLDF